LHLFLNNLDPAGPARRSQILQILSVGLLALIILLVLRLIPGIFHTFYPKRWIRDAIPAFSTPVFYPKTQLSSNRRGSVARPSCRYLADAFYFRRSRTRSTGQDNGSPLVRDTRLKYLSRTSLFAPGSNVELRAGRIPGQQVPGRISPNLDARFQKLPKMQCVC
jgi:hypothetical protein